MDFSTRYALKNDELIRLDDPVALFEGEHVDSDGKRGYAYTVAGWLDGRNVCTLQGGCTVEGDAIMVHAQDRAEADVMAAHGLEMTIDILRGARPDRNAGIASHGQRIS